MYNILGYTAKNNITVSANTQNLILQPIIPSLVKVF